jgi:hypothetical protein
LGAPISFLVPLIVSIFFLALSTLPLVAGEGDWLWLAIACNLGSAAAFWQARPFLNGPVRLAATSIVIIFVLNYPAQAFLVDWLYHSESFQSLWREFSLVRLDGSLTSRREVFYVITVVFALTCSSMVLFALGWPSRERGAGAVEAGVFSEASGQPLGLLLAAGLAVSTLGLLIQVTFGVGSLTSEAVFTGRLDGVLYHTLVTLAPLLFMAVHWESLRQGHKGLARASLGAYVALALAEMSMMSSRGFVVLQMLPLLLLYLWMGYRVRRLAWLGGLTVALTVLLYPVMTSVRNLRANSGYSATDSLALAFSAPGESRNLAADLVKMSARFIGYTSYLTSLEHPDDRFDWEELSLERIVTLRENGFTRWFTAQVAGYGQGIRRHFSSPGLLGAAQVLGGQTMVFVLPPLLALMTLTAVRLLAERSLRLGPLIPVNLLGSLLFLMEEGVFDLILTRIILASLALAILSWVFRLTVPDLSPSRGAHAH